MQASGFNRVKKIETYSSLALGTASKELFGQIQLEYSEFFDDESFDHGIGAKVKMTIQVGKHFQPPGDSSTS